MNPLNAWLERLLALHPKAIELGLERVGAVWRKLGAPRPSPIVITVGGTNGKGSTVAFLDGMLRAAGHRVGTYTSPHVLRYNERVAIDGVPVDDARLVSAFERVEVARGDISLTFFEFGTLAAFLLLADAGLDVAVLEVGMGGRLDAVNLIDADVSVLTTVDLDHEAFLGPDRETIGREKAPIFRPACPAIVGELDPPTSVLEYARAIGARLIRRGIDFDVGVSETRPAWAYLEPGGEFIELQMPERLAAPVQLVNAATAIAALRAVAKRLPVSEAAMAEGVRGACIAGRLQRIAEAPETVVDVGHNPQAARTLAVWLEGQGGRRCEAVFAALGDKDVAGIVKPLGERIARWHVAGLEDESPRGRDAATTAAAIRAALPAADVIEHADVASALAAARARDDGRLVLVFGSFLTVAAAVRALSADGRSRNL
jgi:dihydrofolate synthase/folylpolyglutamate synthase